MTRKPTKLTEHSYFASLEEASDRPEVQEIIREAVRRGTIRVQPNRRCLGRVSIVRIVPEDVPAKLPFPV
jgi:hypothetical protein